MTKKGTSFVIIGTNIYWITKTITVVFEPYMAEKEQTDETDN